MIALISALAMGVALQADPPPAGGLTVKPADWARLPTMADLQRAYPPTALRMRRTGQAIISCTVNAKGRLEACSVLAEAPQAEGFGEAALKMAASFRMPTKTKDGQDTTGGTVQVPIVFRPPQ